MAQFVCATMVQGWQMRWGEHSQNPRLSAACPAQRTEGQPEEGPSQTAAVGCCSPVVQACSEQAVQWRCVRCVR